MNLSSVENVLVEKRKELTRRVESVDRDFRSGWDPDSSERAVEMENEPVLTELRREASEELLQIEQALERLRKGEYGVCVTCGNEINHDRLNAVPYAVECINCAN
ncbi:MAG: TraR/DksA family transcriptional regulator [Gammaproteobacteria bacterium]|nr:MAG: TraR/DksA family transcriptional regulator [Gammaproteobacteria bacterium]RLA19781.1 MAG: TraR/DksA family transcriptional regulator [Gammaproteobacteria bacterium]